MTNWTALLPSSMQMTRDSHREPSVSQNSLQRRTDYKSSFPSFATSASTDESTCSSGSVGDNFDVETGSVLENDVTAVSGLQQRHKERPNRITNPITNDEDEDYPAFEEGSDETDCLMQQRKRHSWSQHCCRGVVTGSSLPNHCPLQFRKIQPSDREEIKRLHELWFPVKYMDEFYDDLVYERMTGTGDPLFTSVGYRIDSDNRPTIAACVVGCFIKATSLSAKLRNMLIHNPYHHTTLFYIMTVGTTIQKQGIGTLLIQQCLQQVQHHPDCGVVYLHVLTSNTAAIQMYEGLGFDRVQEIPNYYTTTDNVRRNCYLYAKYVHGNRGHRILWQILLARWYILKRQLIYLASYVWTLSLLQPFVSGILSYRKRSEPTLDDGTTVSRTDGLFEARR